MGWWHGGSSSIGAWDEARSNSGWRAASCISYTVVYTQWGGGDSTGGDG